MSGIENTVFISYRHANASWALLIFKHLKRLGYDVFFDYESIASGDFEGVIIANIKARAHFLVLLTPSALNGCEEPSDWLRREIETALDTERNIVPIILEGFSFDTPAISRLLVGKLERLKSYNAMTLYVDYFDAAMDKLCQKYLNVPTEVVLHPPSISAREAAASQQLSAHSMADVSQLDLAAQGFYEKAFVEVDLDAKLRYLDEAIRLKPDYAFAYNNRGAILKQKNDLLGALDNLNLAIKLQPGFVEGLLNRADVRRLFGDLSGALSDSEAAIRYRPDSAAAYYLRGAIKKDMNDMDGAKRDCNEAIALDLEFGKAYGLRGFVLETLKDCAGALADYDKAIKLDPDDASYRVRRGFVRGTLRDYEGAQADFDEAIRLAPDNGDAHLLRGLFQVGRGDLDAAINDLTVAIRLIPESFQARWSRAEVWKRKGNFRAAINDLQALLDDQVYAPHVNRTALETDIREIRDLE